MDNSGEASVINQYFKEVEPQSVELLGKKMTPSQILKILDLTLGTEHEWKLSPLLVGVPHPTFLVVLEHIDENQLKALQHEAASESVQHHLTVLVHDIAYGADLEDKQLEAIENEISTLDPKSLLLSDLQIISSKLQAAGRWQTQAASIISKALSLAWNSGRIDLIERLTVLKEHCVRTQDLYIGKLKNHKEAASSGLYAILEQKLSEIYGNSDNPQDFEALKNEESSLEALAKLSIWYPRDYWELGLLPHISDVKELEINYAFSNEQDRLSHVQKLMQQTQENLNKLGLSTVYDLKRAQIFSRQSLKDYIIKRRAK